MQLHDCCLLFLRFFSPRTSATLNSDARARTDGRANARTHTCTQMTWMLASTREVQTLENHEYLEFRYGELFFNNSVTGAAGVEMENFNVTAWVLRLPTNNR